MNDARSALVLFSGGQDSTTCLAWALERFAHVETVAFDYRQRHRIELDQRLVVLDEIRRRFPDWAGRLGEDHFIDMGVLGQLSETSLTRDVAFEIEKDGLPNTFVPGRNLLFFTFAAAIAWRRAIRNLVGGMCETDFSGYPDCRDNTIKALQVALEPRHGPELRAAHAADVARQVRDLVAGAGTGRRGAGRDHPRAHPHLLRKRARAARGVGSWLRRVPRLRLAQTGLPRVARRQRRSCSKRLPARRLAYSRNIFDLGSIICA